MHHPGVRDPRPARRLRGGRRPRDRGLLADADHAVADAYGTWVERRNYGKTYWGVQRSTFIIDPAGTIANVIEKASPKTHDDEVLTAIGE